MHLSKGLQLDQTMVDFEGLCHLPDVGGALDDTFMFRMKPATHGDLYITYCGCPAAYKLCLTATP